MARDAFNSAEVVKEMANVVPVIVDGDMEQSTMEKYGVRGFPTVKFMNSKGEVISELEQRTAASVIAGAQNVVKKSAPIRPSKGYVPVYKARVKLEKALAKNKTTDVLEAIEAVEKACKEANHLGSDFEFAQAERAKVNECAAHKLDEAKTLRESDAAKAKTALEKVVKEFPGTPAAEEAKKLIEETKA